MSEDEEKKDEEDPAALARLKIFEVEQIDALIKGAISFAIGATEVFSSTKLEEWCTNVTEECVEKLSELRKPFKYLVFCDITQNCGSGMHHMISSYWDEMTDRYHTVIWTNRTILVVVSVIGVAIDPGESVMQKLAEQN